VSYGRAAPLAKHLAGPSSRAFLDAIFAQSVGNSGELTARQFWQRSAICHDWLMGYQTIPQRLVSVAGTAY
jgi:hypothetical protein